MSIEYQLYSMSSANHIIIPIVGSRQNLDEQNVFKHSYLNLTPQKDTTLTDAILWKKSMSAFKKFKQKRDRKERRNQLEHQEIGKDNPDIRKQCIKLIRKTPKQNSTHHIISQLQIIQFLQPSFRYYDPNAAPLYELGLNDQLSLPPRQNRILMKQESVRYDPPSPHIQRVESYIMEQEMPIAYSVKPRPDDPFIIIRKQNTKKGSKNQKSKFIKKEKIEKCRERMIQSVKEKGKSSGNTQLQNDPLQDGERQKSSERESSEERLSRGNRQIYTLSQIIKSAYSKSHDDNGKDSRQKQVLNFTPMHEEKPISQ